MKKPEELKPFEWTLLNRTDLYFRLPDGQTPETVRVEIPCIYNGVGVAGESEHIIVRNLIVKHVWNDGYNIHHASKNIAFENVAAIGCGDDSVSAHENCTISVKNLVAIGNGTGVCHGSTAEADHENMYIADSDSRDFFVLNRRNSFRNIAVEASAPATRGMRCWKISGFIPKNREHGSVLRMRDRSPRKTSNCSITPISATPPELPL